MLLAICYTIAGMAAPVNKSDLVAVEVHDQIREAGIILRQHYDATEMTIWHSDDLLKMPQAAAENVASMMVATSAATRLFELVDGSTLAMSLVTHPVRRKKFGQMLCVMTNPDARMEAYSRLSSLLLWTFVALDDREPEDDWVPEARWMVFAPFEQVQLEKAPAGYAGVLIQTSHIYQDDDEVFDIIGQAMHSQVISIEHRAEGQGDWLHGENPLSTVRKAVGEFAWPSNRNLVPWGTEPIGAAGAGWELGEQPAGMWSAYRYSDAALEALVFDGIGQHRVTRIDRSVAGAGGSDAPPGAVYAVLLGFAATLEQEDGFEPLGADGYFDADGRVVAIVRGGVAYMPDGPAGTGRSCAWGAGLLGWRHHCSAWSEGWLHAKLAFRGTLFAVVTLVDHLLGMHLTYGNALSITSKEELPPSHPLRQLMQALTYRTDAVNYASMVMLLAEKAYIRRATALTPQGMTDVFAYGNSTLIWETVPDRISARGVDTLVLPMDEDGRDFYDVLRGYADRFLQETLVRNPFSASSAESQTSIPESPAATPPSPPPSLPPAADTCGRDPHVSRWYLALSSRLPPPGLPQPLTCASLADVVATFAFDVTAGHRHVGSVAAETEDPCFAPWAWRTGELCGTPRQSHALASLMSLTSQEQPRLVDDYSFLFDSPAAKTLWWELQAGLLAVGERVDARNDRREAEGRRRYRVFEVDSLEVSIAI